MEPITEPEDAATDKIAAALAAAASAAFSFVGVALLLLTGWLSDVADWVATDDEAVVFPSMAPLVKVVVAIIVAVVIGAINYGYRWAQTKPSIARFLPGRRPVYTETGELPPPPPPGN